MKFDKEQLKLGQFIAHGTFGAVYQGDYKGQKVAVKALDFGENRQEERAFMSEATLWSKLDHPNVAKFIGATQLKLPENSGKKTKDREKLHWCMVSEFLEGGTLEKYLRERGKKGLRQLPLKTVIRFALDVARGLAYMHSEKVVHRDVKTNNMVLDGQGRVKLIDFGVSRKEAANPSEMTGNTGTNDYMAPEVRRCQPYDHKCDVFSFGICLWEIFYCRMVEISPLSVRPMVLGDCPPKLADLMFQCWVDIQRRPEMAQVVNILEEMSAEEEAKAEAERKKKVFKGCFGFFTRS